MRVPIKFIANTTWDAGDMGCGELVIDLRRRIKALSPLEALHLIALDPGVIADIPAWCRKTGNQLKLAEHPHFLIERKDS